MKAIELSSQSFDHALASTSQPVLVDFHAEWCGPCRMMGPVIEQVAGEQQGKAVVAKVNVDDAPDLAQRYGISSIPTLIVFKDAQPVATVRGAQSKSAIESLIARGA